MRTRQRTTATTSRYSAGIATVGPGSRSLDAALLRDPTGITRRVVQFDAARADVARGLEVLAPLDDGQAIASLCRAGLQAEADRGERARAERRATEAQAAVAAATALLRAAEAGLAERRPTQIADTLFISRKTASAHVSSILASSGPRGAPKPRDRRPARPPRRAVGDDRARRLGGVLDAGGAAGAGRRARRRPGTETVTGWSSRA